MDVHFGENIFAGSVGLHSQVNASATLYCPCLCVTRNIEPENSFCNKMLK